MTTEWVPVKRGVAGFGTATDGAGARDEARVGTRFAPVSPLPREGWLSGSILLGVAALVGLVAVGLGTYAFASRDARTKTVTVTVPRAATATQTVQQALTLVAAQTTERIPLAHSVGRIVLVVAPSGRALLVVHGLGRAPTGRAYQAWVIPPGKTVPESAAVFRGAELVVPLGPLVDRGAVVAVTLERAGGAAGPSHAPTLVAKRV